MPASANHAHRQMESQLIPKTQEISGRALRVFWAEELIEGFESHAG
jgi:hypothetical protein